MEDPNYYFAGDSPPYAHRRSSPTRSATHHNDPAPPPPNADPDTCRICRGESTPDEPLFYPCKCSGSIKYVHQDCLMEWLSHSQKKHCELCKTPFRFTKLYSPRMPSNLPMHVFFAHMARYVVDNVVVWLRALLVGCVWLFWVPYLMRRVWSLLFWLSDEGLGSLMLAKRVGTAIGNATSDAVSSPNQTSVLSTIISLAENQSAADLLNRNSSALPLNDTLPASASVAIRLPYLILGAIFPALMPKNITTSMQDPGAEAVTRGTLLSDVKVLQNLTRQPSVNRFVIMVLEGQIITVLVIICFILVILVRDYVVQQQPEINMRAAFAAAQDEARQEERAGEAPQAAGPAHEPPHFHPHSDDDDEDFEWDSTDEDEDEEPERDARTLIGDGEDDSLQVPDAVGSANMTPRPFTPLQDHSQDEGVFRGRGEDRRPPSSTTSAETEDTDYSQNHRPQIQGSSAERLFRIYQEAGNDQEAVLRVLRAESEARLRASKQGSGVRTQAEQETSAEGSTARPKNTTVIPTPSDSEDERPSKGKARENPPQELPAGNEAPRGISGASSIGDSDLAPYSRRRAVSDGPQPREFVNPLANNNWSFSPISNATPSPSEQEVPAMAGPSSSQSATNATDLPPVEETAEDPNPPPTAGQTPSERENSGSSSHGRNGIDLAGEEAHGWEDEETHPPSTNGHGAGAAGGDADAAGPPPEDPQRPLWARVADFLWGDIGEDHEGAGDEAEPADDDLQDAHGHEHDHDHDDHDDAEVLENIEDDEDGAPEPLDQDALDDIEDFEGIMELIGMRGPLMGLFQNAVFCACLVFVTVFVCIFLPYNLGRTSITVAANPVRVVRMFFALSKLIQDVVAVVVGGMSLSTLALVSLLRRVLGAQANDSVSTGINYTWEITTNASSRLSNGFLTELPVHASEIQNFSAISHEALLSLKGHVAMVFTTLWSVVEFLLSSSLLDIVVSTAKTAFATTLVAKDVAVATTSALLNPGAWIVDLDRAAPSVLVNPELASWSGGDRFWAIIAGYISFAVVAGLYVSRWAPISGSQVGQDWEASVVDVINQASGVTKVILIIGIEMLVFPLYCGLLMDAALLPLFEAATLKSRYEFTANYPLTSMFVHWFVGTGYMFHFALFVSMCRKIMRKGVLCKFCPHKQKAIETGLAAGCIWLTNHTDFIRDPDDPEFHPVRDVLERNFFTQLRKIMFSALVYGGLVIVCLGGVVWGLRLAFANVLPIHYSSNEPVLEFPVDLLFYNFLMPLAVKVMRPSDALHAMYTWWFRRCARMLRLTWFLFGRRQIDEEGRLVLAADSPHRELPWYRRLVLKIDDSETVVPKSLGEMVSEMLPSTSATRIPKDATVTKLKKKLVRSGQLVPDGRFVRSPASDQVRIPKGRRVFLDVGEGTQEPLEANNDQSSSPSVADLELYYSDSYQLAYLPPNFRMRVFYFIFLIWMFAAVTGVGLTIVPLIIGRRLFKALLPDHVRTNDIYAFSIGVYVLGTLAYSVLRARTISAKVRGWAGRVARVMLGPGAPRRTAGIVLTWVQFVYAYFNIFVFFPLLASTLVELYVIIPLHTYLHPPREGVAAAVAVAAGAAGTGQEAGVHTIRAVQAWTLGLLYLKLASRMLRSWEHSRLANASQAIFRRGYLRPDVPLLTRAFVLPAVLLAVVAVLAPPLVVVPLVKRVLGDAVERALVYRVSFVATAAVGAGLAVGWSLLGVFRGWKARVRDEAYLVGERLHNFGARRGRSHGVSG